MTTKIGLVLNFVGTLMIAFSFAKILPTLIKWIGKEEKFSLHHFFILNY